MAGAEGDGGATDRAVLGVVDDAVDLPEDGSVGCGCKEQAEDKSKECKFAHGAPRGQRIS